MLTAASLLLSFAPPQKLATDDPAAQRALFDDFKSRFSKSYATADEEALRLRNFVSFLSLADERNAAGTGSCDRRTCWRVPQSSPATASREAAARRSRRR